MSLFLSPKVINRLLQLLFIYCVFYLKGKSVSRNFDTGTSIKKLTGNNIDFRNFCESSPMIWFLQHLFLRFWCKFAKINVAKIYARKNFCP